MDIGIAATAQAAQVNDFTNRVIDDADRNQHPEVTALAQDRDPEDSEQQLSSSDPTRKWSPLTTFWNEMGDDKPPAKKRE